MNPKPQPLNQIAERDKKISALQGQYKAKAEQYNEAEMKMTKDEILYGKKIELLDKEVRALSGVPCFLFFVSCLVFRV